MAEYNKKIIKMVDYEAMRAAFDEKFKETRRLIENGEDHLDNLAEGFHEADGVIFRMPTADVAPVVHGRLINERMLVGGMDEKWAYDCSYCGETIEDPTHKPNYCPNCGAKMDGE